MISTTTSALTLMMHLLRLTDMDLKVFVTQITFFPPQISRETEWEEAEQ